MRRLILVLLAATLWPRPGRADGFDAQVLRLAPVGRGTVTIEGTEPLRLLEVEGSVLLSWAKNPVEMSDDGGQRLGGVVDSLALADLRLRWRTGEIGSAETVAEARAIRHTLDVEIAAVLTADQLAELEARRAAFLPDLGLTDEQRAQIRGIVDDWRALVLETARDLRESELSPREAAEILFDGARAARTAVCGVLEPDQQALFPRCEALLQG